MSTYLSIAVQLDEAGCAAGWVEGLPAGPIVKDRKKILTSGELSAIERAAVKSIFFDSSLTPDC